MLSARTAYWPSFQSCPQAQADFTLALSGGKTAPVACRSRSARRGCARGLLRPEASSHLLPAAARTTVPRPGTRSSSMKDASHVKISSVRLHAKFTMLLKCIGRPLPFDPRRRDSIVDLCDCTGNLGHSGSERSFECQSSARASARRRL